MKRPDKGDKTLQKILNEQKVTEAEVKREQNISDQKEALMTVRRHAIGTLSIIEKHLMAYTPKCVNCYRKYGFITKCVCTNDKDKS